MSARLPCVTPVVERSEPATGVVSSQATAATMGGGIVLARESEVASK